MANKTIQRADSPDKRISVFLKTGRRKATPYDFPTGEEPTVREIVERYLQEQGLSPLSNQDKVYAQNTSDFTRDHSKHLLGPNEIDGPFFSYEEITVRKKSN